MNRFFVGDLWIISGWDDPFARYKRFLQQAGPAYKHFIEALFLYDQVILPTQDFMTLTALIDILGESNLHALLESQRIRFCRYQGDFAYIGNGGGLIPYAISSGDSQKPNVVDSSVEDAVNWACIPLGNKPSRSFKSLVIASTDNILPDVNNWTKQIIHETYMMVLNNSFLSDYFFQSGNKNLKRLNGIKPNAVRGYTGLFNEGQALNEIDIVLMLAFANLELKLFEFMQCNGYSTGNPVHHIDVHINTFKLMLGTILGFEEKQNVPIEKFGELKKVVGIPDVGEEVLAKKLMFEVVVKATTSENGVAFRNWFHNEKPNASEISAGYNEFLREQSISKNNAIDRIWDILKLQSAGSLPTQNASTMLSKISDVSFSQRPYLFLSDLHDLANKPDHAD